LSNLLVGEEEFVLCYVIMNRKQGPGTALAQGMSQVAGGKLEHGRQSRGGVEAKGSLQAIVGVDQPEKRLTGNTPGLSGDLDSAERI
jgi:hypothetical protein